MKKLWIICFILISVKEVHSRELEAIVGANYTSYEESGEALAGVSAKLKMNWYESGKGWFTHGLFRGDSIANVDAIIGYGYKSSGASFYEIGVGLAANPFFGYGAGGLIGFGSQLRGDGFVNLNTIIYGGGLSYIMVTPMIGTRF
jgi:hypothetical protein